MAPQLRLPHALIVSFTFLNCCFGSGLLAIPQIAVKIGIFWFVLFNVVAAIFSSFCFYYIIKEQDARFNKQRTLTMMISAHYGKYWILLLDIAIIFCLLPVSYIAVASESIADAMDTWLGWSWVKDYWYKILMKFIVTFCIMYPLTWLKTIKVLNYVSSLCIVFVFVTVIYVVVEFFIFCATGKVIGKEHHWPEVPIWPHDNDYASVFTYICMFLSLYSMHATIPCLMREYTYDFNMDYNVVTKNVRTAVYGITIPIAFVIYTGFGLIGAFLFDYECNPEDPGVEYCFAVNSNVLLAFTGDNFATVIELLFSIVVFVSFPCMMYPIRKSIINFFKIDANINTRKGYLKYNLIGLCIAIICFTICSFLSAIDQIESFTANLLGIVLYGLSGIMLWYKVGRKPSYSNKQYELPESTEEPTNQEGETLLNEQEPIFENEQKKEEEIQELDDGPEDPPLGQSRTILFWVCTVVLLCLNVLALGSEIYTWI